MTVSNVVSVALHVWICAAPESSGVHWNTRSGATSVGAHDPLCVLVPAVLPVKVPPDAGMTAGLVHASCDTAVVAVASGVGVTVNGGGTITVGVGVRVGIGGGVGVPAA